MEFKKFSYNTVEEIIKDSEKMGLNLNFSENMDLFKKKVKIGNITITNSLAIHPMEGCDGKEDGSPDELTKRRYRRFARGGSGLIWFEAVAVVPEGRANPRQLWINEKNAAQFKDLFEKIMENAHDEYGDEFNPVCIMQLTHSGRFSKPYGKPEPIVSYHNPYLNKAMMVDKDLPVITDDELEQLEEKFVEAAQLAKNAGFHGVDVKACHRYLNSELLSAFTRDGKYGGDFENRTRFLVNIIDKIKHKLGSDFIITTRLNIYDGIPYPYGWGMNRDGSLNIDLAEPIKLVKILNEKGVKIINTTMGTPYYNPHVNRPYDIGEYIPDEHPLEGVARLSNGIAKIQKAVPQMAVVGTGYSWLRHLSPYLAAGNLENKNATLIGYGREAFAYPDYAKDILEKGYMQKDKCCIACGKCTQIMRAGGTPGCVIKDSEIYAKIYRRLCK